MKKLFTVAVVLVLTTLGTSVWAESKTVTLSVPGMTCAACPITIKKALSEVEGVTDIEVSFERKSAALGVPISSDLLATVGLPSWLGWADDMLRAATVLSLGLAAYGLYADLLPIRGIAVACVDLGPESLLDGSGLPGQCDSLWPDPLLLHRTVVFRHGLCRATRRPRATRLRTADLDLARSGIGDRTRSASSGGSRPKASRRIFAKKTRGQNQAGAN